MTDKLRKAAQAIVDRWDSPARGGSAENLRHTGEYIAELRAALAQQDAQAVPQGWREFLKEIEWANSHYNADGDAEPYCVCCDAWQSQGHKPDCKFIAMLNAAPTPPAQEKQS